MTVRPAGGGVVIDPFTAKAEAIWGAAESDRLGGRKREENVRHPGQCGRVVNSSHNDEPVSGDDDGVADLVAGQLRADRHLVGRLRRPPGLDLRRREATGWHPEHVDVGRAAVGDNVLAGEDDGDGTDHSGQAGDLGDTMTPGQATIRGTDPRRRSLRPTGPRGIPSTVWEASALNPPLIPVIASVKPNKIPAPTTATANRVRRHSRSRSAGRIIAVAPRDGFPVSAPVTEIHVVRRLPTRRPAG